MSLGLVEHAESPHKSDLRADYVNLGAVLISG